MAIEKWLVSPGQSKVIDVELVRSLKVSLVGGKVDIIGHDEPGARIEVHSVTGKDLKVSIDGDALEIDHPQLRWDNFIEVFASFRGSAKAEISLSVPRDIALKLGVVSADALVAGLRNDAKLNSVSGELVTDDIAGDLDLNTVSGEVSVQRHRGRILAHSVSGDIVASGAISKFNSDSVTGDVVLDIDGTPGVIEANTVSGDLTVRIDEGFGASYRINTVSGTLQFGDSVFKSTLGKGFVHREGELSGSWLELAANSVSGNVTVVRRAEHAQAAAPASDTADESDSAAEASE